MWDTPAVEESSEPATQAGRPKVLYVMGAGRSGSTILGVALGNCEHVFFAGELDRWFARAGIPRDGPERERFWGMVRDDISGAEDLFATDTTQLERSSRLFDLRGRRNRGRLRRRYRKISEDLYLAIARASGATHIVDSSHYPLRAWELRGLAGVEMHLLFLVRDAQSVVASLGRRDVPERRFGVIAANAYLWLTYVLSVFVFLRQPRERRMFVRHEDFLANPESVLGEILARWGSASDTPEMDSLQVGVPFHGNRLIKAGVVALQSYRARTTPISWATWFLQLPWTAVFARLRPAVGMRAMLESASARR